jgi:hypothetical protein
MVIETQTLMKRNEEMTGKTGRNCIDGAYHGNKQGHSGTVLVRNMVIETQTLMKRNGEMTGKTGRNCIDGAYHGNKQDGWLGFYCS